MNAKTRTVAALFALLCLAAARPAQARPAQSPFGFRQGQSVYIVAFTRSLRRLSVGSFRGPAM